MTEKKLTRKDTVMCLVVLLGTLAIYAQLGGAQFINYDDNRYVTENPHVQSGMSLTSVKWALTSGYAENWHPLTWISHMVDCRLFGQDAGKHHLVNVGIHAASSILLFIVLRLMTGAFWRCAFVAVMFAWHPVHVESVAWIAERKDVLSTFFMMLTLLAYSGYARKPGTLKYLVTLALFALGLMSKPMLVTLPFVLLLLDFWPLQRWGSSPSVASGATAKKTFLNLVLEKMPFFFLSAVCSYVTYVVQSTGGTTRALDVSLVTRLVNALISYCRYAGKLFWPSNLAVFYPYDKNPPVWQILGSMFLVAGVSAFSMAWFRKKPWLCAGWFWFLGTLVPVIGIIQVGDQGIADRYDYIPSIGIFIFVAWGFADFAASSGILREIVNYSAIAASITCIYLAHTQAHYWQNSETLFRHALAVAKDNPTAEYNLGQALQSQNKYDEAIVCYKNTIRLDPTVYMAFNNLGFCQGIKGDLAASTNNFISAINLKPDYWPPYLNLAVVLQHLGEIDRARSVVAEAEKLAPHEPKPHFIMGTLELEKNNFAVAREELASAAALSPADPNIRVKLATALSALGDTAGAISEYQTALRLKPDDLTALNNLAWIRAASYRTEFRNGNEAVALAQKACELSMNSQAFLLGTLAAAYAEAGRFTEAVETAKTARDTARAAGQDEIAAANERLMQTYQKGKAFHDPAPSANPQEQK